MEYVFQSSVNEINVADFSKQYADFPEERRFTTDGIIMNWNALRSEDDKIANNDPARRGNTLVHEFGHWMGLIHSFGDSNCGRDDGIADTYQTSNAKPGIYDDYQAVCGRPDLGNKWIHNFMSVSSVLFQFVAMTRNYPEDEKARLII